MTTQADEQNLSVTDVFHVANPLSGSNYNENIRGIYNCRKTYNGTNTYYTNDVVLFNGIQYIRTSLTHGSQIPTDPSWEVMSTSSFGSSLSVVTTSTATTTSSVFVDLPAMTLTTTDDGIHLIIFTCYVIQNPNNRSGSFIININGVDVPVTERVFSRSSLGLTISMSHRTTILNNIIVKIRYNTTSTLDVLNRELILIR